MDSRLRDRERSNAELEARLRTLTTLLQKEQKTREAQASRVAELEQQLSQLRSSSRPRAKSTKAKTQERPPPAVTAKRTSKLRKQPKSPKSKPVAKKRRLRR